MLKYTIYDINMIKYKLRYYQNGYIRKKNGLENKYIDWRIG